MFKIIKPQKEKIHNPDLKIYRFKFPKSQTKIYDEQTNRSDISFIVKFYFFYL